MSPRSRRDQPVHQPPIGSESAEAPPKLNNGDQAALFMQLQHFLQRELNRHANNTQTIVSQLHNAVGACEAELGHVGERCGEIYRVLFTGDVRPSVMDRLAGHDSEIKSLQQDERENREADVAHTSSRAQIIVAILGVLGAILTAVIAYYTGVSAK